MTTYERPVERQPSSVAAAGAQPLKECRIVKVDESIIDHLQMAMTANFPTPAQMATRQIEDSVDAAIDFISCHTDAMPRLRRERVDEITSHTEHRDSRRLRRYTQSTRTHRCTLCVWSQSIG